MRTATIALAILGGLLLLQTHAQDNVKKSLEERVANLEKEVRELRYPELHKGTEAELKALRIRAKQKLSLARNVQSMLESGRIGSAEHYATVGAFHSAMVDLYCALGDLKHAIKHQALAVQAAQGGHQALKAMIEAGGGGFSLNIYEQAIDTLSDEVSRLDRLRHAALPVGIDKARFDVQVAPAEKLLNAEIREEAEAVLQ